MHICATLDVDVDVDVNYARAPPTHAQSSFGPRGASAMPTTAQDRDEIIDVLAAYGSLLDREQIDEWLELFTPDCEFLVYGRIFHGPEGLRRMTADAPGGLHLGAVPTVKVNGDEARAGQSFLFVDQKTHEQRIGWYDDELVRLDGRWRIARRRCTFLTADGPADRP
jgi:hypothetical protein